MLFLCNIIIYGSNHVGILSYTGNIRYTLYIAIVAKLLRNRLSAIFSCVLNFEQTKYFRSFQVIFHLSSKQMSRNCRKRFAVTRQRTKKQRVVKRSKFKVDRRLCTEFHAASRGLSTIAKLLIDIKWFAPLNVVQLIPRSVSNGKKI